MGSAAIASASRVGSSSGSVLADSKTKYWVSDNSSYNVSYGSPGNYDEQGQLVETRINGFKISETSYDLLGRVNGLNSVANELADYLADKNIKHGRGAPFHPQTLGKAHDREGGYREMAPNP